MLIPIIKDLIVLRPSTRHAPLRPERVVGIISLISLKKVYNFLLACL